MWLIRENKIFQVGAQCDFHIKWSSSTETKDRKRILRQVVNFTHFNFVCHNMSIYGHIATSWYRRYISWTAIRHSCIYVYICLCI